MRPLTDSLRYRQFIDDRDRALERVLHKYLDQFAVTLNHVKRMTLEMVAHLNLAQPENALHQAQRRKDLEHRLEWAYNLAASDYVAMIRRMRRSVLMLSKAGEAEAIARGLDTIKRVTVDRQVLAAASDRPMAAGGSIEGRVTLALDRLKRAVIDAVQMGQTMGETTQEILTRVDAVFPKGREVKVPRRILKVQEADDTTAKLARGKSLTTGFIDDEGMADAADDYLSSELPSDIFKRGPDDKTGKRYDWEIEQETIHDFVEQVRDGENQAAKENGIEEFMVIAIIDDKTDTCCIVRDGKTVTQIEEEIKSGEIDEEECEGAIPPFHFNCRCKLAPVTAELSQALVDNPPPDFGAFDDWLWIKSQGL